MKQSDLMMVIRPEANETKLLMMKGRNQVMKAVLPPASRGHHRAASTLVEALALWYQQQLSVVLYADVWAEPFATGFCDVFGFGEAHLHYEVEVVDPRPQENGKQLSFTSCFSELEELCTRRCP
jgi:hypothetical protein